MGLSSLLLINIVGHTSLADQSTICKVSNRRDTQVVSLRRIRDPKSVRLKDRDYDVTPNIIAHMYPQIRNGSVKECEVEMVGEECEVYCEDGRRRVLVLTGHAGRVAPISPMLKRRISCGLEILN